MVWQPLLSVPTAWWPFFRRTSTVRLALLLSCHNSSVQSTRRSFPQSSSSAMVLLDLPLSLLLIVTPPLLVASPMVMCLFVWSPLKPDPAWCTSGTAPLDAAVRGFFASFGEVHSVSRSSHDAFPGLLDGNCLVKISMTKDIPASVRVAGYDCRVWYRRQPAFLCYLQEVGSSRQVVPSRWSLSSLPSAWSCRP